MTLRLRLMVIIGMSFTLLWGISSVWMFVELRMEFRDALDERLAASARMVAGLVAQMPDTPATPAIGAQNLLDVAAKDGVACEVRLLHGGLIARTHNSPKELGMVASGFSTRTIRGEQWRSYTLELDGKRVTTADRVDKRQSLLRNIVLATVVPFLVAIFGSLIVLWFGIRRGLAPLESIRQALATREPDAMQPLAATHVPAELVPLVQTINLLLERTQHAIERERRFTGDAAHELRTPLTAIKTHIQVARLTTGDAMAKSWQHAEEGVQRLQHTLEQLLTLARVEGPFSFAGEKPATAIVIAETVLGEFPATSRQRIVLENNTVHDEVVAMPPVLLMTALRNLLDNALRYSPSHTPVILRLNKSDGFVCFSVLDHGAGMSELDHHRAVQRFWRKGSGHGSGLGLSIVEAIVKRFGGSFRLHNLEGAGLLAQIDVPCVMAENQPVTS